MTETWGASTTTSAEDAERQPAWPQSYRLLRMAMDVADLA
jgi:hypothetical protein